MKGRRAQKLHSSLRRDLWWCDRRIDPMQTYRQIKLFSLSICDRHDLGLLMFFVTIRDDLIVHSGTYLQMFFGFSLYYVLEHMHYTVKKPNNRNMG
ncbi:hypothetical protein BDR06DRAFT_469681 [Suillus hirtellus]|nr:hypothetical protein BDR06DRAFT_469681 [Suillus hirtellus]